MTLHLSFTNMNIEEVFNGSLRSNFILVIDSATQKGDQLIDAVLQRHLKNPLQFHALCFEHAPSQQECRFQDSIESVTLHDLFISIGSFLNDAPPDINICHFICSKVAHGTKINLWIDSLSSALISIDVKLLYNQIHRLLNRTDEHGVEVVQLVSSLHADVETSATVNLISSLASTVIHVKPATEKQAHPSYSLTHTKPNGKIFKETRLFSVGERGKLQTYPLMAEMTSAAPQSTTTSSIDKPVHDSFSTFRHGLSTEEQQSRDRLVLPFQQLSMGARGQGRIEYEPEETDEWDEDEEDPDDDLEV
ncbi:hypothetical protein B566_EDAN000636 [Ephemera danica]|nr:hypothetical protein B566_EDAN000636 [Ephemera danica]